ncbi:MAG: helix-turn-helix transcriptional regulator [bacterium]|nr:helix-turn-helix transcriptional regulator [bacterium]
MTKQIESDDFLYKKRISLGLTLVELAKKLQTLGVPTSPSSISRIERSLTFPHPARLTAYCSSIGITTAEMPALKKIDKISA